MPKLSNLVSVSEAEAFSTEINLKQDFYNQKVNISKLRGYVPNQSSRDALNGIIKGLHPTSPKRVHLITGSYGTGKSHLGLVLANFLSLEIDDRNLQPLLEKINEKSPELKSHLVNEKKATKPYLVVIPEPHWDPQGFNHSLLAALIGTLRRHKIDYQPRTDYQAAIERIKDWKSKDKEAYKKLNSLLKKERTNPEILISRIEKYDKDAYNLFLEIHRKVAHGALFTPGEISTAKDVYVDVIKELRKNHNYQGLVIIFDEFGTYLSHMADDPDSIEGQELQKFAEYAKRSGEEQCHFIAIAHRTLQDYAKGKRSEEEWKKIYGRFIQSEYHITTLSKEYEMEDMMDSLIVQYKETPDWKKIEKCPEWVALTDLVLKLQFYPDKDRRWIEETVVKGVFPLHPVITYCLPYLSEKIGQRNRTIFTFFADDRKGGLKNFITSEDIFDKNKRLSFYMLDRQFDYFENEIRSNEKTTIVYSGYKEACTQTKGILLGEKILKAIAILQVLGLPNLRPTKEVIGEALNIQSDERREFIKILNELVEKGALKYKKLTGEYSFKKGVSEISIEEEIRKEKKVVIGDFNLVKVLNEKYGMDPIIAQKYNGEHALNRKMKCQYVDKSHLSNPSKYIDWINEQYNPYRRRYEGDGLILYVISENDADIKEARLKAERNCKHPQLVIAVPKEPFQISELLLEAEAIERLLQRSPFNEPGSEDHQDLVERLEEIRIKANAVLSGIRQANKLYWYRNGEVISTLEKDKEMEMVSNIMEEAFPDTPTIRHSQTAYQLEGADTKKFRVMAMETLLQIRGPFEIRKKGGSAEDTILRETLQKNDMLRVKEDKRGSCTYEILPFPRNPKVAKIWKVISDILLRKDDVVVSSKLINTLLKPPFGMSIQSIDLYLTAFLRMHLDEFRLVSNYKKVKTKDRADLIREEAITAENIFRLVRDPDDFILYYFEISDVQREYLNKLTATINPNAKPEKGVSLWEGVKGIIFSWFTRLPKITRKCKKFKDKKTEETVALLNNSNVEAKELLSKSIPSALDFEVSEEELTINVITQIVDRFSKVVEELNSYALRIGDSILADLRAIFKVKGGTEDDLADGIREWFNNLPGSTQMHQFSGIAENLRQQAKASGGVQDRFLINLPRQMGLGAYTEWETDKKAEFINKIKDAKLKIEKYKERIMPPKTPQDIKNEIRDEVRNSISFLMERYGLNQKQIIEIFREILEELGK